MNSVIPMHWAGMTKPEAPDVFVCGACPDPKFCADSDRCERATDDDYAYADRMTFNRGPGG